MRQETAIRFMPRTTMTPLPSFATPHGCSEATRRAGMLHELAN